MVDIGSVEVSRRGMDEQVINGDGEFGIEGAKEKKKIYLALIYEKENIHQ